MFGQRVDHRNAGVAAVARKPRRRPYENFGVHRTFRTQITQRPQEARACQSQPLISIGTIAASFELRSVSEVFTLRTFGAAVSFSTKAWKVFRSGATHFSTKSISPESIQHSRTSGWARTKFSKATRSASAWLERCTIAKTVTS